ncbi:MAG: ABC transporter ATP-binding protein [Bacteroidia bacterium]|nr:ABC transporter ATP-binding protein [Bacteroidia bacterium]
MKEKLTPIQRFVLLIKSDKKEIGNVYTYAVFQGLINLSIPLGIQAIVNLIQGGQVSTSWIVLVIIVLAGILLTGVLQVAQLRIIENLQQNIFARAAFEFTFRLPRFKSDSLENQSAPELMNRFFDTVSVQKGLSKVLIDFSTATLQIVFGLVLLAFYHSFFIFFGLGLFLLVIAIFKYTGVLGLETSLKESKYKYKVVAWLEEMAKTRLSFKMAGNSKLGLKRTDENVLGYLDAREKHFKVLKRQYIYLIVFKGAVAAGLLLIGGMLVLNQEMNIGQFIAAEIIILLVINSVEKLILCIENIYDVITSLDKIGHVTDIDLDDDKIGSVRIQNDQDIEVEIKDLEFSYPGRIEPLFKSLSIQIQKGQHTCFHGNQGSGKATLLSLIAGIYRPAKGSICYNGLPIDNFEFDSIRNHIGTCFSSEIIFDGTLLENISMGRSDVTIDDVIWASDGLDLLEFIKALPQGFDTIVGPNGCRLSKGVSQKILLARGIVHKPKLLLLEKGVEFIDTKSRKKIAEFIFNPQQPWTVVSSFTVPEFKEFYKQNLKLNQED